MLLAAAFSSLAQTRAGIHEGVSVVSEVLVPRLAALSASAAVYPQGVRIPMLDTRGHTPFATPGPRRR